ncbi:endonuclease/exonuclease/phosphatase family protein [Bacillus tropicus]|uniref:endonuclease/exonuclease/phosphatase family protein n=1 Tax=Bacillus tropicus TaxID=2026188 RepID=UPI0023AED43A|nr:endonuclease/exonuclease/phosphatase family protein [Bacillus tropicus]MDE7552913.1 endonuclease/exonuclease/phosphatase family protein [Bacillus tropicus]MDE7574124.1 endonuclease/exonuclease/phosphatase family protein [Bacillus tropicus]
MKIVAWNAGMAFRKKIDKILPLKADILVISECEKSEKWGQIDKEKGINDFLWEGDNPNKGIGIITFDKRYKIEIHPDYDKSFRYIVPIKVSADKQDFIMFAVWSQKGEKRYDSYIGQIYLALEKYASLLKEPCIIVGDWNSNKLFDHVNRVKTHSEVVEFLEGFGIKSAYHHFSKEEHGEELKATHYFRKEKARPFHIDFLFASKILLDQLKSFHIGSREDWIEFSDHMPISAEFND